jgi:hypothetical protein
MAEIYRMLANSLFCSRQFGSRCTLQAVFFSEQHGARKRHAPDYASGHKTAEHEPEQPSINFHSVRETFN